MKETTLGWMIIVFVITYLMMAFVLATTFVVLVNHVCAEDSANVQISNPTPISMEDGSMWEDQGDLLLGESS